MDMKKLFVLALALCLALSLCACGGDEVEETVAPPAEDVVETPVEEETEAPTEAAPVGIVYTAKVVDEGGNPIVGAMLQLCQGEMCLAPVATNENGEAAFSAPEEGAWEAKFLALPAGYEYTTEEQVFAFGGAFELTITLKAVA